MIHFIFEDMNGEGMFGKYCQSFNKIITSEMIDAYVALQNIMIVDFPILI